MKEKADKFKFIFEKRRFPRIDKAFTVSYNDITADRARYDISQTKNISLGGVLFTADRRFPEGTVLKLKLRVPDAPDYIVVKARVIESKEKVKDLMYDTRVKFMDIDEKSRDFIKETVDKYNRSK